MEIKTEYVLDMLATDSVSVLQKQYFEFGGNRYYTDNIRNAYLNDEEGRQMITEVLPEEYQNAVFAVWGA